jgi:phosphatidylethanolamine-binding protein (PEBP) family uncharacterized protein
LKEMKCPKSILFVFFVVISLQITAQQKGEFSISSSGVKPDGSLSIEFTGEGEGVSMPLEWSNVPKGTKYFAINLWHLPHPTDPTEVKSYWVVYNIPANIKSIPKNAKGFGIVGYNDKDQTAYDPMKSKGPGVKEYKLTIYALAEKLEFNNDKVYRADLLKAIEGKVLGESTLKYTYETGKTGVATQAVKGSEENKEEKTEAITEAQKEQVKAILLHYNAATLTANDAKAIHEAFREAGLRGGPSVEEVIREAGFNPEKLRDLAPPPDMENNNQEDNNKAPDQKKYSIEQAISDRAHN